MEAVFGYGSLILPMSAIGRFDEELRNKIDRIRENGGDSREFLEMYLEDESIEKFEASDLNFVPVKIYGLERYYSLEVYDGGNMLAAEEASDEKFINGVIIFPLDDEQLEKISETEKSYRTVVKNRGDIESYIPQEKLEERGLEIPEEVKVYVAKESAEEVNKDTDRKRYEPYHQYIPNGIKFLAEDWYSDEKDQENLVENFMADFLMTTFEIDDNGEWRRMSEK